MSYLAYSSTRTLLTNSDITDYVSSSYIRVGYTEHSLYAPSITIHQAGGSTWGYLGYGSGKLRRDEATIQINIYHRWTMLSSQTMGDIIDKTLVNNGWYRKLNDIDNYLSDIDCYSKTQIWSYKQNVED